MLRRSKESWRTKICLNVCPLGFPEILVMGSATTAARKVVSPSTLIGPFKIWTHAQIQMDQSEFRIRPPCERQLSRTPSQTSQENWRGKFWGKVFVLRESFDRRSTQVWSEIYWALWNCWFYCDSGLFHLRRKRFVEWRLTSDGWSSLPFHSFRRRSNGFKWLQ